MKKIHLYLFLSLLFSNYSMGQTPGVKWSKYIPDKIWEIEGQAYYDIQPTKDKGFILAGVDTSYETSKYNFQRKIIQGRPTLVKVDSAGNTIWINKLSLAFASGHTSSFYAVQQTKDGGYIATGVAGRGYPISDSSQLLIVKYTPNGNVEWVKYKGGTDYEKGFAVRQLADGGYIVAGHAASSNGDVTSNHQPGKTDAWLIRLDESGETIWDKSFGGVKNDSAYALIQTADNGFLIAGASESSAGEVTGNNGLSDAWAIKTDKNGNLIWKQNIGSAGYEAFYSAVENSDGTYTLAGYTTSATIGGINNHGEKDLLLVKLAQNGSVLWTKLFGGSKQDEGFSIRKTIGNGYLVSGYTESNNGDVSGNNGQSDAWILLLSPDGELIWQKCIGTEYDELGGAAIQVSEHDFILTGTGRNASKNDYDGYLVWVGNTSKIKGTLFLDENTNGIKDEGEPYFKEQVLIKSTKPEYEKSTISRNGYFELEVESGTFETEAYFASPYYNIIPEKLVSNFEQYFETDSLSFAVQPIAGKKDLMISAIPITVSRPGFETTYSLFYKNKGTTVEENGKITFVKDKNLDFVSATPAPNATNLDTLFWNHNDLKPGDSASITLQLRVKAPPVVNISDTLQSFAFIGPVSGDETPDDDTAVIRQIVTGSFDPNDKAETHGGYITPEQVAGAEYLTYLIRFQNMGTDTAFTIVVRDTLDQQLNWNSIEIINASHPFTFSITDGNKLAWTFNNILLPDDKTDEPNSHGYISYRIRTNKNLLLGDIIHNTASIYFDYNLPVQTNDATTEIKEKPVALPLKLLSFTARYKQPLAFLNWSTQEEYAFERFEVERSLDGRNFTTIGIKPSTGSITNIAHYELEDNLKDFSSGVVYYRLKMIDQDGKTKYSNVLTISRNGEQHFTVQAYPNPVNSGTIKLSVNTTQNEQVQIRLYSLSGQLLLQQTNLLQKGVNSLEFNAASLAKGMYTLEIRSGKQAITQKVIITAQ